jgi:hypothetical protein
MLPPTEDELLSPNQAAPRLGVSADTLRRRAATAMEQGERRIRRVYHRSRHDFLATEAVWREFAWPAKVGRPTKSQSSKPKPRTPDTPESPAQNS